MSATPAVVVSAGSSPAHSIRRMLPKVLRVTSLQSIPPFTLAALIAVAACSTESTPRAAAGSDSAATATVPSAQAAAPAATGPAIATAATPAAPASADDGLGDTAVLLASRSAHDRTSFLGALRRGDAARAPWPAGPAPAAGALLPSHRIIAYYGNPHSKKMGVIGEYAEPEMLAMWDRQVKAWADADPSTPVMPAIHLVTVVAQGSAGADGMWRRREDSTMIERTYRWAQSRKGVLFLDIQASHSTLQQELPALLHYLERPDVHLGIDPEFYMHYEREGARPSSKIGMMMASDVNYVINTLDRLVREKHLPPKVLVVHRFTRKMVPDAENIRPTANVQVVMHMDGWGPPWLKFDSYAAYVVGHPVQFTGFKLFYHNDTKAGDALLTPRELLRLRPSLAYVQYQ